MAGFVRGDVRYSRRMTHLPDNYDALAAADKLDVLWERVSAQPYPSGDAPTAVPGAWGRRHLFSTRYNIRSFTHVSDELEQGRRKIIHAWGTCAKVRWVFADGQPYTGALSGTWEGLLRFSDAAGGGMFAPAVAIKLFVDGKQSVNYFGSQARHRDKGDWQPLSVPFSNATVDARDAAAKAVKSAFTRAAKALGGKRLYATYLPLHHLAGIQADGTPVASPIVADRVELHATQDAIAMLADARDFRAKLAGIPAGTRLFEIRTSDALDADAVPAGYVDLTSGFVASPYGDEKLFFQHDVGPTK